MSSVCDANGTWWFHCQGCDGKPDDPDYSERGRWVSAEDLRFQEPSERYPCGRDLCPECYERLEPAERGVQDIRTIHLEPRA